MSETVELENWAVIAAPCDNSVLAFVDKIREAGKRMGFTIGECKRFVFLHEMSINLLSKILLVKIICSQLQLFRINVNGTGGGQQVRSFIEMIEAVVKRVRDKLQMIMCVLPTNDEYLYAEIKRKCYIEYGGTFFHHRNFNRSSVSLILRLHVSFSRLPVCLIKERTVSSG